MVNQIKLQVTSYGVVLNSLPYSKDGRMSCFRGYVSFHIMFEFKQFNKCSHFQNVTVNLSLLNCYSFFLFDLCCELFLTVLANKPLLSPKQSF